MGAYALGNGGFAQPQGCLAEAASAGDMDQRAEP